MRSSLSFLALGALSFSAFAIACGDSGTGGAGGSTSSTTTGSSSPTTATGTGTSATTTSSGTTTTTTSTGGGMAQAECTTAADCKLEDDCCACAAIPNSMPFPVCMLTCAQSACMALQYTGMPDCQAGRCVAAFNCDEASVTCDVPSPACNPGQTAEVAMGCFTGNCVPATECSFVSDCTQCSNGQACASYGGGIMKSHCIDVPPECNGAATCACLGESLCGGVACGDDGNGHLTCLIP